MYELKEIYPSKPEGIECHYYQPERSQVNHSLLIVSFSGEYPNGSLGKEQGRFIARQTVQGLVNFNPNALILGFRELSYNWGSTMLRVFQDISDLKNCINDPGDPSFPVVVVYSEKSLGVKSLCTPAGEESYDLLYTSIDDAITRADELAEEWLEY